MAKGGINLSPGADPVLVAAATRAAMANVPKDLSGTFENLAQSYATTMQSLGQSWSNIISNVGEIGEFAVKAAMKSQGMIDKGSGHMLYREGEGGMDETYEDYVKGYSLNLVSHWAHIQEKNMSCNLHGHGNDDCNLSAVYYPCDNASACKLVFQWETDFVSANRHWFEPTQGVYYLFPSYLKHWVTRNLTEKPRVSISFNFNIISK